MSGVRWFPVFVVAWAVVAASLAFCDDYESGWDGEGIYPVLSKEIRMARERVEILVGWPGDGRYESRNECHGWARVDAEFVLVNDTDYPVRTLVSFPGTGYERDFGRSVDGCPVGVETYTTKDGTEIAYTSSLEFAARQVRTVRVSYVGAFDAQGGTLCGSWRYVLKTGALWKGKIGEIVVVAHFPKDMPPWGYGPFDARALKLSPKGYKVSGQSVTWLLKNVEPTEDVSIEFDHVLSRKASRPLKYASREEAPRLQLQLALAHRAFREREEALRALKDLRRVCPNSDEAAKVNYYMAGIYSHHWVSGGRLVCDQLGGARARRHYEQALGEPLTSEERTDCLSQLFALYTLDAKDPKRVRQVFAALKDNLPSEPDDRRTLVGLVALASPQLGMELLDAIGLESDAEKARVLLSMAMRFSGGRSREQAVAVLSALIGRYPTHAEDAHYWLARCHRWRWAQDGKLKCEGADPANAVKHYEEALKQPLSAWTRRDCLAQLFALYTLDAKNATRAEEVLTKLEKNPPSRGEGQEELAALLAAVSPRAGARFLAAVAALPLGPAPRAVEEAVLRHP
ncbi:MAG: hypothetical protein FJ290_23450 [Planctomycetes bacterium]|nr:hypothetical protein [Planctomycetota bacterium]